MILDPLALTSIALFVGLALVTFLSMPKRDRAPGQMASLGCITSCLGRLRN